MLRRRSLVLVSCVVAALPVVHAPSVSAARGSGTVRVTLHRLASSDGRYERTDAPEWIADAGNRVALVTDGESLDVLAASHAASVSRSAIRNASTTN